MKVVNGGHDGPPATVAQMAAIEFPAAMEVARLPWASRTQSLFAMSTRAYQAAGVICELLLRGKAEIVSMVAEDPDRFDGLLEELATAADDCRTLLEVISSARPGWRLSWPRSRRATTVDRVASLARGRQLRRPKW
jgi:hypothetical protein